MLVKNVLLSIFSLVVVLSASFSGADASPSAGAKGLAGAKGTFEFKPEDWITGTTTFWKDSDGVAPDIPGCHIGTDGEGNPNGRLFGEACLSNGLLVESNPGPGLLHSHKDDIGHPDTFDCNEWCKAKGASRGYCSIMPAPPCERSAMCACE